MQADPKLFIAILAMVAGIIMVVMARGPKKIVVIGVGVFVLLFGSGIGLWSAYYIVDEGEAYVITRFGQVVRSVNTSGIKFKLPFEKAIPYPSRIQSYKEAVSSYSSDGSPTTVEFSILLYVNPERLEQVYEKIAKNYSLMEEKIIIPTTREVARNAVSKFTATDLFLNRTKLSQQLSDEMQPAFDEFHIVVEDVKLREIQIREDLVEQIQAKLAKQQEAEAMVFEKEKALRQAEIIQIEAQAQAQRQKTLNNSLTTRVIQYEAIQAMKELARSTNKSFVVMPTDSRGTGVPLILNSN